MTATPVVELETDAVPIVRVFGTQFRRALRKPEFRERVQDFRGCFALASNKDPQALTVAIDQHKIRIHRGVSKEAAIVVRLDFDRMNEPGYRPKVQGLLRHPLLAFKIGKLLDLPTEHWADAAKRFWEHARDIKGMPVSVKVASTDETHHEIVLGEGEPEVEIYGESAALTDLFTGASILVEDIMKYRIKVVSSLEHVAVLSDATQKLMLGEIDREH